jgi:hypothetical protein
MERDWAGELETYLRQRLVELCEALGQPPSSGLRISPPLAREEAKYFILGLEDGIFSLDAEGHVQSELFAPPTESGTEETLGQIFWSEPLPPRLFREVVCQFSVASSLILRRGWLKSQVLVEPSRQEYRAPEHGVDIMVKSATGELLIAVVIKRGAAELQKLITDLQACCKRGAHAENECGFPQNHPKYEFCASSKPIYFWGVAPDTDVCLRMKYNNKSIELEQLVSLPPRSLIEFN